MFNNRSMLSTRVLSFVSAGVFMLSAVTLRAQGSSAASMANTEGMVVGAQVGATMINRDGSSSKSGIGAGALIGYGFTRNIALLVGFDLAKLNLESGPSQTSSYNLTHLDFSARYSFVGNDRAWAPYLNVAVSGRGLSSKANGVDLSITGLGYGGGGGVQYFINRNVGVDLGLLFETGKFDKSKVNNMKTTLSNAGNSPTTRISLGVRYYPHIGTALHK